MSRLQIGMSGAFITKDGKKNAAIITHIQMDGSLNLVCWDVNGVQYTVHSTKPEWFDLK